MNTESALVLPKKGTYPSEFSSTDQRLGGIPNPCTFLASISWDDIIDIVSYLTIFASEYCPDPRRILSMALNPCGLVFFSPFEFLSIRREIFGLHKISVSVHVALSGLVVNGKRDKM